MLCKFIHICKSKFTLRSSEKSIAYVNSSTEVEIQVHGRSCNRTPW